MRPFETIFAKKEHELCLHQITSSLMASYLPLAVKQNSFFVNDVPAGLPVIADKEVVSTLLGSLFYIIARCSRDTCIRVSAKTYHDVILLHIRDSNTFNSFSILSALNHLQMLAEKIGGYVDITSQRQKVTTVAFSFTNVAVAA